MCSEHLGFFKKLKATQGSLERKTIDEIKTINEFGQIIIGKSSLKICQIPSEVISVRVTTGDPHTKEYTFQELQELISLIVLITGKNKAENQSGMHRFLEVSNLLLNTMCKSVVLSSTLTLTGCFFMQ